MLAPAILIVLFCCGSFVLGAVPFGKLIASGVAHLDITKRGSGNIGATNVAREAGVKWGIITLLLDCSKGFVPAFLFMHLFDQSELLLSGIALATLLGHQYSIFLGFRGGKGVATALGIFLALSPLECLIGAGIFTGTVCFSGFVSVGSMLAACIMPLLLLAARRSITLVALSALVSVLICIRHKDNIRRLLAGEENRWRGRNPC
ncbi:MAG: glycerol-3-phosphate 1-O-acyltransferase PlsY [Deltaproteobacteria bacterium]|nr:glycerol-3-phosphate 1-O-acyltransferase PlsY [Deltaproteobacteria bacterium]